MVRVHPELLEKQTLPPELVTKDIWKGRFHDIRSFERYLTRNGVVIRKFFLHVSKGEQKRRFLERLENLEKNWKFSANDIKERAYWGGNIAWASAKDVSQCPDAFLIGTERTITGRGLSESATRIIPKMATVVVARGATTGRFCMFGHEMAMNQTCYALSSAPGRAFWLNCAFGSLVEALVREIGIGARRMVLRADAADEPGDDAALR